MAMTIEDIFRAELTPAAREALIRAIALEDVTHLETPLVDAAHAAGWYRPGSYERARILDATTRARAEVAWAAVKDDLDGTDVATATFTFHPASGRSACRLELESLAVLPNALED